MARAGHVSWALGLVFLIGATQALSAGTCRYGVCFGALAVGDGGVAARIANEPTAHHAFAAADRICRGGCTAIEIFHSGCGEIVQGGRTDLFSGFGETREDAHAQALDACGKANHRSCVVRVRACTRR
ncbi:MAG: DUF4189 domain-containing protein [Pseudomonadota bacterium]